MTDPNYTAYLMITDISGSMWSIMDDAQGGIRQFVTEQAALPGRATLSFYEFSYTPKLVHDFANLQAAEHYIMSPTGGTALLDAMGTAITEFGKKLADLPESQRPGKVVVMITTDGEENQSREWTLEAVNKLVTQQQEVYGWAFSYAGADLDAFAEAAKLGIGAQSTLSFAGAESKKAYTTMSHSVGAFRGGMTKGVVYDEADQS